MAQVVLSAWLIITGCAPSVAQDPFEQMPQTDGDFAYQRLVTSGDKSTDVMETDTPDADSSDLTWTQRIARLAQGRTQLEGGYSYLCGSTDGVDWTQHAVPDMLLRFGLTDRWELRLGWPGYVSSDTDDPAIGNGFTGTMDPNVGILHDLWGQNDWIPQTAILATVPVPLEGNPFALNSLQPLAELMYSWQTNERMAFTGRSGFAIYDSDGDNYIQFQQSFSWDVLLTERLGTFLSWDMLANHGSWNDTSQHMAGGGLSFLLTERFAISWRSAVGISSSAPDFLNDIRFAYRF